MSNSLANETISKIEEALEEDRTTAISEIIQIIQELAGRAFSISVPELSQLIGRDPTITAKLISAANTLGFNPSGTSIHTISEAIQTVGFEKIRNLAISLLLAENAGQTLNTYEQREMAALSVCSGLLAQELMQEMNPSIDTELVFVCSSLRNYGKLLMSTFLVEQFREARSLALEMDDDEAFRQVFGITPLGLGRYLLKSTNLPRSIMASLREVSTETLARAAHSDEEEVLLAAEFCARISEATFDNNISTDRYNDALMDVITKFQCSFSVTLESVNNALVSVDNCISQLNRVIGMRDDASPSTMKLRARVSGSALPVPPPEARISPFKKPKRLWEMNAEEREDYAEAQFQKAVDSIINKRVHDEKVSLREIYQTASRAIMDGLMLENCMVFVREEYDPASLSARFGYGPLFEKIKNRPLIHSKKKDVFGICLARKEDILIHDTEAGKIQTVIPDWIHSRGGTSSFVALPTVSEGELFAIILGTVSGGRSIRLEEGDLRRLRLMRVHLAAVRKMADHNEIRLL